MRWLALTVTAGVAATFVLLAASPGDQFGWEVTVVWSALGSGGGGGSLWARRMGNEAAAVFHPSYNLLLSALCTAAGARRRRSQPEAADQPDFVPGLTVSASISLPFRRHTLTADVLYVEGDACWSSP
jgi:hypothetical protein